MPTEVKHAHLVDQVASRYPEIGALGGRGGIVLDLGCGPGATKGPLEAMGYSWVGMDVGGEHVSVMGDAHRLPFPAQTFGCIVSLAVIEHLHHPWVAVKELGRVAQPNALFFGTAAFLEPMHDHSYFHPTHLGLESLLRDGGFTPLEVWPGWHVLEALAWFNLVENAGRRRMLAPAAEHLARSAAACMHWLRARRQGHLPLGAAGAVTDRMRFSGSFCFVARREGDSSPT